MIYERWWTLERVRKDGLILIEDAIGNFEIQPADGRPNLTSCPCCDKPLKTVRAAQLVANGTYPIQEASP